VLQKALDPANFRRSIEASGSLISTDQYVAGARHRPARLYRYDDRAAAHDPPGPTV
jgi:8-oxo-dGTP diphosphatase